MYSLAHRWRQMVRVQYTFWGCRWHCCEFCSHSCVHVTLLFTHLYTRMETYWLRLLSYFHVMVSLCRCVWFLQIQQLRGGVRKLNASITENFWFISGGMMVIQLTQPCGWNVHTLLNAAICFGIGECEVHHNWAMYRKYKHVPSCDVSM